MLLYLFVVLLIYIVWKVKDYFHFNELKNYSKTSTPIIKTSFNMAYLSQGHFQIALDFRVLEWWIFVSTEEIFTFPRKCADQFQASYVHWFFGMWAFEVCRAKDVERILGPTLNVVRAAYFLRSTQPWHFSARYDPLKADFPFRRHIQFTESISKNWTTDK